jgi:hypothetical protein
MARHALRASSKSLVHACLRARVLARPVAHQAKPLALVQLFQRLNLLKFIVLQ